jgi:integrase
MKSRTGYTYFDQKKKRWVGRVMLPADPVTGKRKSVRRFGMTEADVRKKLRKLVDLIEDDGATSIPVDRMTFAELAKEYEQNELIPAEYIGEKKVAGRRDLRSSKAWLKSLTEHFGKRRLNQITFGDIKAYKLILIRRPVRINQQNSNGSGENYKQRSIAAINRELEFFRTVLNYAVANGKLTRNPFKLGNGQSLIEKSAETKRERFPTFGEEMALLRVCVGEGERGRAHLRPILIIAADTGLRRNEMFTLERYDLDFHRRVINVRAFNAKTNRPRPISMTQRVYEELLRLCEKNPEGRIFGGLKEVKRSFGTACRLNGIKDLHFHDLRHAFISRSILAGVPPAVALKASGHASEEWKRYLNMTPDQLQNLFRPLEGQDAEEVKAYGWMCYGNYVRRWDTVRLRISSLCSDHVMKSFCLHLEELSVLWVPKIRSCHKILALTGSEQRYYLLNSSH